MSRCTGCGCTVVPPIYDQDASARSLYLHGLGDGRADGRAARSGHMPDLPTLRAIAQTSWRNREPAPSPYKDGYVNGYVEASRE